MTALRQQRPFLARVGFLTQCMVRPCVARGFRRAGVSGLASMYPVSDWSCFAPDQYGYQRACDLIVGQTSMGQLGHQCSHAPGRPILHLFVSSRRPRRVTGGFGITSSLVLSMLLAIRRIRWRPRRVCSPRSFVRAQERSRRCGPVCWPAQSRARCGAAASVRLQSRT